MMSERRSFQRQGREGRECAHQFVIADRARAVAGALLALAASAFQLRYIISRRKNYVGGNRSQLPNWISTYEVHQAAQRDENQTLYDGGSRRKVVN